MSSRTSPTAKAATKAGVRISGNNVRYNGGSVDVSEIRVRRRWPGLSAHQSNPTLPSTGTRRLGARETRPGGKNYFSGSSLVQHTRNSSRGYVAVDRSLFDDPMFASGPFTELHAFLWMATEAAWQPRTVRCGRALVNLQRGQLAYATRFLAVKFRWSEARVRRFLKRLSKRSVGQDGTDARIDVLGMRDATLITILNYDRFQLSRRVADAASDGQIDASATRSRRKEKPRNLEDLDKSPSGREDLPERSSENTTFDYGLKYLCLNGQAARGARSLLGRWRKQYGNAMLAAVISEAEALAVSEPVAWITAALRTRSGETDDSGTTRPHPGSATPVEAAFLASMARGAINVLEKNESTRSNGSTSRGICPVVEANAQSKPTARD
jgi:hypothetical protein